MWYMEFKYILINSQVGCVGPLFVCALMHVCACVLYVTRMFVRHVVYWEGGRDNMMVG